MARFAAKAILGIVLLAGACTAPPPATDFSSPDSASRIESIRKAARDDDTSKVRNLVEQLDSDDPLVRLTAIAGLERLTGETNGYHYDDPPSVREPAIERWVAYVNRTSTRSAPADG